MIQKLVNDRIKARTAYTPARMVVADGLQHPSVVLHPYAKQIQGRAEHWGALKDKVYSLKDIHGLLGGRHLTVVLKYLKSCHIEGPEIYLRCWG